MKRMCLWLWLLTKRQLKSVLFLILLLAVPAVTFFVSENQVFSEASVNGVALFCMDDDPVALKTVELVCSMDSGYDFYLCDSKDAVYEAVLNEEAVCGYIFNEDISRLIVEEKYNDHITVVKNRGDLVSDMINEVVFSAYFKEFTRVVTIDYIRNNEKFDAVFEEAIAQFNGAYDIYVNGNGTFKVEFESLGIEGDFSNTEAIDGGAMTFPLRGVMAVLIFMGALLGAVNWLSDSEKGVFKTLGYDFVNLSRFFYCGIPAGLLGISALASLLLGGQSVGAVREMLVMAGYVAAVLAFGALCTVFMKKSSVMVSVIPVIIMASLLVCPVFIDLSVYVPAVGLVRKVFLPFYYIIMF